MGTAGGVAVVAVRHDGRAVVFTRCDSAAAAQAVVAALARLGLRAGIGRSVPQQLRPGAAVAVARVRNVLV
jgi:hypothetical protein